ncbi:short-chain dehydrogenase [Actinomadura craniellae]|uniref:Short-chain dehydrogenase n=1 Tax=Actinomadura craniellae TaxID=2231787 RepID=A0A365GY09_9ACTN|nr:SDR family oxidoreductase [Actinomadura craniellae]RAY11717.1 short-chain dehydrogenase [Actinomadura craniellae]
MPTAFITGATAGIGAAFARRLASDGFDLVLLARDGKRLAGIADELGTTYRIGVEVLPADLSTDEGISAAEQRVAQGVDLLVNNAGFGHQGVFLDVPVEDEITMLRVHCEAVLRLTSAALPGMIERGRGGVINVASVAAFLARGTYSASKIWVVGFSQSVMQDLARRPEARNVYVMAVCPGWVRTEFHERAHMDVSNIPDRLWLSPDRVVDEALRDLRRGVQVSVPGLPYKAVAALTRLVPRSLSGRLSSRVGRSYT